jgi:AcrR family transcriptional regulator
MEESTAAVPGDLEAPRARIDRERILAAAEAIVRREGVARVTMRRIGAELGADPTAVYRRFHNKRDLLVALADRLFGTLPELESGLSWREQFKAELRHAMYRYRSHPDLAALLAVQPDDTPSLQVILERRLALLADRGLSVRDATRMSQVIENHVVGTGLYYGLIEHAGDPRLVDPAAMRRVHALLPADRFPRTVEASPQLFPDLDESFDLGTELILEAIERLAQHGRGASGPPATEGTLS